MTINASLNNKQVGQRLKAVRENQGLTQAAFAKLMGVSAPAYKNYERGVREIPASLLRQLHRFYLVDPLWIIMGLVYDYEEQRTSIRGKNIEAALYWAVEVALDELGFTLQDESKQDIVGFLHRETVASGIVNHIRVRQFVSIQRRLEEKRAAEEHVAA